MPTLGWSFVLIAQSTHGADMTAQIAEAQQTAIERIAEIVKKHNIDCDFVRIPGYMFHGKPVDSPDFEVDTLHEVYDAASGTKKLAVKLVPDAGIKGFNSGKAIRYDNQATFHPTKYIRALAKVIEEQGGKIYEKTRMMSAEESGDTVTGKMADGKEVRASAVVLATNVPEQKVSLGSK